MHSMYYHVLKPSNADYSYGKVIIRYFGQVLKNRLHSSAYLTDLLSSPHKYWVTTV